MNTLDGIDWRFLDGVDWSEVAAFASIPVVASMIGYGTNVLAIQMTFLPLDYVGFFEPVFRATGFSLGWQGIIPANAAKIAEKAVTIMTQQLVTVDEVFCRLDSKVLARTMREPLRNALERVVEQVAIAHCHDVWESLPLLARAELVDKAVDVSEPYISDIVDTLRERVHDVLDLHALATEKLLEDKALMNEVFKRCGEEEFKFIERSGFYFGFLLGIVQAMVWWLLLRVRGSLEAPDALPLWWYLPTAGALCGYVTNALALGVIFNPIEPVYVCGVKIQGLFLQRQREVSQAFAGIVASRVVTAAHCWENILSGRQREALVDIVTGHVCRAIDEQAAALLMEELPQCLRATYAYTEEAMEMEHLLCTRMQRLPSAKFERVLHPAFEEDEWKLIGIGGLLGVAVGTFQLLFVFSGVL